LVADVADNFGEVRLRVTGASMVPAIWPGDILTVRRVDPEELRPGQIVLYRRQANLIAHRVTRVVADHVVTRGDTLPVADAPASMDDVVGRVVSLERNGRRVCPQETLWPAAVSLILRRSDFCLRVALRLGRLLRRPAYAAISLTR
jgi:signal peptidase